MSWFSMALRKTRLRPRVVDEQSLQRLVAQQLHRAGEVAGRAGGKPAAYFATSPSAMPCAANISRALPSISFSIRCKRLTRQRTLYSRSRLAQMSSITCWMVRLGFSGGSLVMAVAFLK